MARIEVYVKMTDRVGPATGGESPRELPANPEQVVEPRDDPEEALLTEGGPRRLAAQCLVATLVVFGVTHVVEVKVLGASPAGMAATLHGLRGLAVALIVGLIVARHYRSVGAVRRERARESAASPTTLRATRVRRNAEWFIGLRWFAVAAVAAAVVIGVPVAHLLPDSTFVPLTALTLTLVAANLAFSRILRTHGHREGFLLLQVFTDLAILTLLLHFSGGLENALSAVYIFHVLLGGILLRRKRAYLLAGAASLLYAALGLLEMAHVVDHYTLRLHPHDAERTVGKVHSSHDSTFVLSHIGVMTVLLFCSTYFTTLIVSRLRRTEDKLFDSFRKAIADRLRLERVVDAAGAGLALRDAKGQIEWRNDRAERWLRDLAEIDRDAVADPGTALTIQAAEIRSTVEEEFIAIKPGERRQYLLVTATPVLDEKGGTVQVVELIQDVSERRVAEARLAQSGKLAALGELAGNVAHEVNNPVGVISAKARLLLRGFGDGQMPAKVADELRKIVSYSDRIAGITGDMLTFARPSSGEKSSIDANDVVCRAMDLLDPRVRAGAAEIELDLADELLPIHGNSNELQQVVVNLSSNALDAMPEGGRLLLTTRVVDEDPTGEDREVVIEVADEGPGISPVLRKQVFDPFFTTKPEGSGTGLGLSICHGLVRSHHGHMEILDALGGGTLVRVRFPACPEDRA
jgi:signal transduction histidine kinase